MSLIPSETPVPQLTLPQRVARNIVAALGQAKSALVRTRSETARAFWASATQTLGPDGRPIRTPVAAADILAAMTPAEAKAVMLTDLLQRINIALTDTVHVSPANRAQAAIEAFVVYSPVPSDKTVSFADASGAVIDPAPEVAALLAKLAGIEAVSVADKVTAE